MYQIKYENFEGPLDLLLELFERKKMDITKLSLAKIADDYLAYIENSRNVSLANLSDFLITASQLILIKSKALLPLFEFTKEEEEEIEDLQVRLMEYQKFKKASSLLGERINKNKECFFKQEEKFLLGRFIHPHISKNQLSGIFIQIKTDIPEKEELAEDIMQEIVSLEEKISQIRGSLEKRLRLAFSETIKDAQDKIEIVVSFLAILEMIKQKIVFVRQEDIFSEIQIGKRVNREK